MEGLFKTLEIEAYIGYKDAMGYADDILIFCDTKHQLTNVINSIKKWSVEYNLKLNAAKSGILEFFSRKGKKNPTLNIGEDFEGLPVVAYYKYLGMWVDSQLSLERQAQAIAKKTDWMTIKLWHILQTASLTFRINLWTVFIRPLFEILTIFYNAEKSVSKKQKVDCVLENHSRNSQC